MNEEKDIHLLEKLTEARSKFLTEIGKSIIGQKSVLDHILIALFCKGHTLLVGVPGLAKTLMIKSMAEPAPTDSTVTMGLIKFMAARTAMSSTEGKMTCLPKII